MAHFLDVQGVRSSLDEEKAVKAPPGPKGVLADPVRYLGALGDPPAHELNVVSDAVVRSPVSDHPVRVVAHVRRKVVLEAAGVGVPEINVTRERERD